MANYSVRGRQEADMDWKGDEREGTTVQRYFHLRQAVGPSSLRQKPVRAKEGPPMRGTLPLPGFLFLAPAIAAYNVLTVPQIPSSM